MHSPVPTLLAAAMTAATFPVFAASQDSNTSAVSAPLQVVVTGTRSEQPIGTTPGQVDVITRAHIDASGAQSVVEALRASGAVQINQSYTGNGNDGVISMRGFGENAGQNVLVLVDGRPLNNPTLQAPDLASISLNSVERIEVFQGSAGTLYGQYAVGGVVNIITRSITGTQGQINASSGSYDRRRLNGSVEHRFESGLGLAFSADSDTSDGYRDNSNRDYDQFKTEISYQHERGEVRFSHEQVNNNQRLPGALNEAQVRADRRQTVYPDDYFNEDLRIDTLYVHQQLNDHLDVRADWSQRDSNGEGVATFFPFPQDTRANTFMPRMTGHWDTTNGPIQVTAGIDVTDSDYQAWNYNDITQNTEAAYARLQLPVSPQWMATLGGRHSKVEDRDLGADLRHHDSLFVKELGLTWTPSTAHRLFIRRDENFRFATADENGLTLPGVDFLDPQTGVSWELGWAWTGAANSVELTLYQLDLDDEILFDSEISNPQPWDASYQGANINLDSSRRRGLVLSAEHQLSHAFRLGGTYTFTDSELTAGSFKGNEVPYVARHQFSLYGNYRFDPQWNLYTDLQYTGSRYPASDDANAQSRIGSDLIVNTSLRWSADHWNARINMNNLFNRHYYTYSGYSGGPYYYPAAGRNLLFTLGYTF
ncbi:TonB-dependent receptor [Marinobacterium lacunae]|uniref:TonB-dependent receptor n=1 Tax=Marinobacterium lacunae TaxID=1232683 RepID=A0A081FXI4_9GAMM|nr:TonB-dependent receptor [Marinobacterium lacunae]KEA63239.1 TonB-dependent receptor [Marinobacterium lacunae]